MEGNPRHHGSHRRIVIPAIIGEKTVDDVDLEKVDKKIEEWQNRRERRIVILKGMLMIVIVAVMLYYYFAR
ncbi:MAG: hypothetical protein COV79_03415 [Parcubacteria group bacterium CG11_big_fil_rev_8_21_14_0_20_41_14]|nr:MAG: hypothetical protein COV79_03415 [Parcubacteria group bacterium CG11_big_fil_rev_8_21_14_0_20_41_14]